MKINEITEGFGSALGSAFARYVGADTAANTIDQGQKWDLPTGFSFPGVEDSPVMMQQPSNTKRIVNTMVAWGKRQNNVFTDTQIGKALATKFPKYWASEQNKPEVIKAIATEIQKAGVKTTSPSAPVTKDEPISIGGEPLDPSSQLYKQLQAKAGNK